MKLLTRGKKMNWFLSEKEEIKLITVSCVHTGDKYGMLPLNPVTKDGGGIIPSPIQKKMYRELIKILKEIGHVDIILLMGDLCEGKQLKSYGVPLNDSDTDNQVNWFAELYQETFFDHNSPDIVISIMGTPYHAAVGIGGNLDYQATMKISGMGDTYFGYPNARFYLGKEKLLWDLQHRVSIAHVNRLMPFEKIIRTYAVNAANDGGEVPDVIGRAHNHGICFPAINVSDGKIPRIAFDSACLKADDIYGQSLSYPGTPKIGVTTMLQDGKEVTGKYHAIDPYPKGVMKV